MTEKVNLYFFNIQREMQHKEKSADIFSTFPSE